MRMLQVHNFNFSVGVKLSWTDEQKEVTSVCTEIAPELNEFYSNSWLSSCYTKLKKVFFKYIFYTTEGTPTINIYIYISTANSQY